MNSLFDFCCFYDDGIEYGHTIQGYVRLERRRERDPLRVDNPQHTVTALLNSIRC